MRLRIVNPIDRDFGMVPRALWTMDLPFQAKGLAAYLFCLRDGAVPYVAEIEASLGIGRDARRKAFAALEAAGLIEWYVEHDRGRIVGKTLLLHPARCCAPENQADGKTDAKSIESINAPEIPAGGKHVPKATETRPSRDCGSGDTLKQNKEERARQAREAAAKRLPVSRAPVARPKGGGAGRASVSQEKRPSDPWVRAASAAEVGMDWLHPVTNQWRKASDFPEDAEKWGAGRATA